MQKKPSSPQNKKEFRLKRIISFLFPFILCAADTGPLYSKATEANFKTQEETASNAATKAVDQSMVAGKHSETGTSDVMIVDPKVMSKDWADAFQSLQKRKLSNITFGLKDNTLIRDVSDVEILSGGYLMLFSIKTIQGPKYKIVKTSDITSLTCK